MTTDGPSLPQRDELRVLAEKATPGPWWWRNTQEVYLFGARSRVVMGFKRMGMSGAQPEFRRGDGLLYPAGKENINGFSDAAYIAAASPDRILALLDDLDALAARRDDLAEKVARVEALRISWLDLADEADRGKFSKRERWVPALRSRAEQLRIALRGEDDENGLADRYLSTLERMNPSPRLRQAIDEARAALTSDPAATEGGGNRG